MHSIFLLPFALGFIGSILAEPIPQAGAALSLIAQPALGADCTETASNGDVLCGQDNLLVRLSAPAIHAGYASEQGRKKYRYD